mmetsp:Transcript_56282/g.111754  ORF Transcript_56282/g.111754 Transcript_56282/m.111754 type:complete len:233 (-) Transcript_56282:330-1028(-)
MVIAAPALARCATHDALCTARMSRIIVRVIHRRSPVIACTSRCSLLSGPLPPSNSMPSSALRSPLPDGMPSRSLPLSTNSGTHLRADLSMNSGIRSVVTTLSWLRIIRSPPNASAFLNVSGLPPRSTALALSTSCVRLATSTSVTRMSMSSMITIARSSPLYFTPGVLGHDIQPATSQSWSRTISKPNPATPAPHSGERSSTASLRPWSSHASIVSGILAATGVQTLDSPMP